MVDYLIVGQGIAGSILAWYLLKAGQRILVINNQLTNQASEIAAGLYNPITGRHLAKTWLADQLFPTMEKFYTEIENKLQVKLLYPYSLFRPFLSQQEQVNYVTKHTTDLNNPYIQLVDAQYVTAPFYNPHGGMVIKQAGYLDTPCFLSSTRRYLESLGLYKEEQFDYEQLQLGAGVQYKGVQAGTIIFCEGAQAKTNPFFSYLPFRLVKGELLTIGLQEELASIYNGGLYIIPQPMKRAIVGSTYNWQDLSLVPTKQARDLLEGALQKAGVRPATFDRRPFIGIHPEYPSISIFNGLGTKGVSLAPYLAEQFVAHLLEKKDLPKEVRLNRG
jgi:glycine/D-amino acid oxidase-like deaminating enzyme